MHTFDSAKVKVRLRPCDVEMLMDGYFGTYSHADYDQITDLALAYADHSRVCALLASGWREVVRTFASVFGQVTDIHPSDSMWLDEDRATANAELERRFTQSTNAFEWVQR